MAKSTKTASRAKLDKAVDMTSTSANPPANPKTPVLPNHIGRQNQLIPLKGLHIDESYQRPLQEAHIARITKNFDQDLFTAPIVVRRLDGSLWVVDGQQRIAAIRTEDIKATHVWCSVIHSRDVEHEAWLFVQFDNNQKKLNALQLYKANYRSGEPMTVACEDVLRDYDLTGMHTGTVHAITAVRTMRDAWGPRGKTSWAPITDQQLAYGSTILRRTIETGLPLLAKGEAANKVFSKDALASMIWIQLNAQSTPDTALIQEVFSRTTSTYIHEVITGIKDRHGSSGGDGRRRRGILLAQWINSQADTTVVDLAEEHHEYLLVYLGR